MANNKTVNNIFSMVKSFLPTCRSMCKTVIYFSVIGRDAKFSSFPYRTGAIQYSEATVADIFEWFGTQWPGKVQRAAIAH